MLGSECHGMVQTAKRMMTAQPTRKSLWVITAVRRISANFVGYQVQTGVVKLNLFPSPGFHG